RHGAGAGADGLHFDFALLLLAFARRVLRLQYRRREGLAGRARTGVGGVGLPLPPSVPASSAAVFAFGADDGFCPLVALAPGLTGLAPPLPSCLPTSLPTSSAAIFGFGTGSGASRPAAAISRSRGTSITKRPR